jgi:hypothetical protein
MLSAGSIREFARFCSVVVCVMLAPVWAHAQTIRPSVTGIATDSSGAVLPGVTVEVMSPALIEKTREAVTDGSGSFRIIELEAGTYTVTFTLPGFSSVKREGLELTGSLMATVNAELRVGGVEETITVTGASPIVDVQSSRQTQAVNKEVLTDMPMVRTATNIASILVPAMNSGLSAYGAVGTTGPETGRLQIGGVGVGSGTSGTSQYRPDTIQAVEMVISSFGNLGEAEVGSPVVNIIPRAGGNSFSGTFYVDGANDALASNNTDDLVARRDTGAQRADPYLATQYGSGRPHQERPAVVLRDREAPDRQCLRHQYVGQQERGQPSGLDLRPGPRTPGHQ